MDREARRRFLQSALAFSGVLTMESLASAQQPLKKRFAIALHGGAGSSPEKKDAEEVKAVEESLANALDIGVGILEGGGTSLDAVEKVIRFLEDDPLFNAGRGAVFNAAGAHELDASIMDGRTKACGGVAAIRTVKNPISLARMVMEKTKHVLLASDGAEQFADEMKVERVANSWFSTEKRRQELEKAQQQERTKGKQSRGLPRDLYYGTVGCVALDSHGNLAAGTSTGGRTNKKFGRVGDSPINGAGNYANNATCAVSGTGIGEEFIRHAVAYDISARMTYLKQSLKDSVHDVMHKTLRPDDGGLIAVGADGSIVMDFSTGGMARAAADSGGFREVKLGK
jgi:beta-aspartyl-peptidase (threonine type)